MLSLSHQEIIGYSAGIITFLNMFLYMRAIVRSGIRPSLTYWILSEISMILIALSSFSLGDRTTLWIAVAYAVMQIAIIWLALGHKYEKITSLDKTLFFLGGVSVFLWWYTNNPLYALVINVGIDASSYIPLYKKTWHDALSEDTLYWEITAFASVINMFAITNISFEWVLYPWYLGVANLTMMLLLILRKPRTLGAKISVLIYRYLHI